MMKIHDSNCDNDSDVDLLFNLFEQMFDPHEKNNNG